MKLSDLRCITQDIDLDKYIEFRESVKERMEHPEWLGDFSKGDLVSLLEDNSEIWVYYLGNIAVCSTMLIPVTSDTLNKFGLDLDYREVIDYGPTFVNYDYIGNSLQYQMLLEANKFALSNGYKFALSTVHPDNFYSINNLLKNNFEYKGEKTLKRGIRNVYLKKLD